MELLICTESSGSGSICCQIHFKQLDNHRTIPCCRKWLLLKPKRLRILENYLAFFEIRGRSPHGLLALNVFIASLLFWFFLNISKAHESLNLSVCIFILCRPELEGILKNLEWAYLQNNNITRSLRSIFE